MAVGGIGSVDVMVAEAHVLGDHFAGFGVGVKGGREGGEVAAEAALALDDEGRGGGARVAEAVVREACEPRAGAMEGVGDEASSFAIADGGEVGVGGVEGVEGVFVVEPGVCVDDSRERTL